MRGLLVSFLLLFPTHRLEKASSVVMILQLTMFFPRLGRAAAVLGGGGSFDLCDDYDGLEGTREILEAYKRGAFTHRPTEESEKKEKELKIEELIPNDKEKEKNNIAV